MDGEAGEQAIHQGKVGEWADLDLGHVYDRSLGVLDVIDDLRMLRKFDLRRGAHIVLGLKEMFCATGTEFAIREKVAGVMCHVMSREVAGALCENGVLEVIDRMKAPEIELGMLVVAKVCQYKPLRRRVWQYFPVARLWALFGRCGDGARSAIITVMNQYFKIPGFMSDEAEVQELVACAMDALTGLWEDPTVHRFVTLLRRVAKRSTSACQCLRARGIFKICKANIRSMRVRLVVETCRLLRVLLGKRVIAPDEVDWEAVFVLIKAENSEVQSAVVGFVELFMDLQMASGGLDPGISRALCGSLCSVITGGYSSAKEAALRCVARIIDENIQVVANTEMVDSVCAILTVGAIKDSTTLAILKILRQILEYLAIHASSEVRAIQTMIGVCLTENDIKMSDDVIAFHMQILGNSVDAEI